MGHEHIHVVRVETPQARLQGTDHGLAAVAGRPWERTAPPRPAVLRDDYIVVSVPAEQPTEHGFRLPVLIDIGRVERRTTRSDEGFKDLTGSLQSRSGVGHAEVRGPERKLGHPQPGLPAEGFVMHGGSSMVVAGGYAARTLPNKVKGHSPYAEGRSGLSRCPPQSD